jgi:hypothetical protein
MTDESIDEPITEPINEVDNTPATHGDLDIWGGQLMTEINGLKKGQDEIKQDVKETKSTMKRVLEVVESIDEHNKENKDVPERVTTLEDQMLKLKGRSKAVHPSP